MTQQWEMAILGCPNSVTPEPIGLNKNSPHMIMSAPCLRMPNSIKLGGA